MSETPSPSWVLNLKPYVPGKPIEELQREYGVTHVVKLASNENPLGPSPAAVTAMRDAAAGVHLYPDPGVYSLRHTVGERFGVDPDHVLVSNGSNEMITLLVRAFTTPAENVVFSQYGFIAYKVVTGAAGVQQREVPADGLSPNIDAMIAACDANTRLLFLANPNNPTGTWTPRADVERLLREVPEHVLVVLDEAYTEYVDAADYPDGMSLLAQRANLVVMRTFSKAYGLAGCRVGYAVAPAYVCDRVNRIREPFNVNHIAQAAAIAALGDAAFIDRTVALNRAERERIGDALDALGVTCHRGQTNFVLIEPTMPAMALYEALLKRGVIVRPLAPYGLGQYLRVTLGTEQENDVFLSALRSALEEA